MPCLHGFHPATDWEGVPFPLNSRRGKLANQALNKDGFYLGMFMLTADLDEVCNMYGLRHFNALDCCYLCHANTSTIPWTDLGPEARWRSTIEKWPHVQYPPTSHRLWDIPGLNLFSISWDILHGLDLGASLHVNANILDDLIHVRSLGNNQDHHHHHHHHHHQDQLLKTTHP